MDTENTEFWKLKYKFQGKDSFEIMIFDINYILEYVSTNIVKITREKGNKKEEKYIGISPDKATFFFQPDFYDLPVMIKLNQDFILASKSKSDFFIDVPIKIVLKAVINESILVIDELKDSKLLHSFYGPANLGIFCNAIYTDIYYSLDSMSVRQYSAMLPLALESICTEQVNISRLLIHTDRLSLFSMDGLLLTNRLKIKVNNPKEGNIEYGDDTVVSGTSRILKARISKKDWTMDKIVALGSFKGSELQFGF